ncbi:MAG: hypothetical protein Q9180_002505 [Flavoplaca navasiana]
MPKRKRKESTYFPSDSNSESESGGDDGFNSEIDGALPAKRAKATSLVQLPIPLRKEQMFPFASLPPELRNKIYAYALISDEPIHLISRRRHNCRHTVALGDTDSFGKDSLRSPYGYMHHHSNPSIQKPSLVPSFLALNQQINAEAQLMLYGANIFAVEDMIALHTFLARIGVKSRKTLKQLSIKNFYTTPDMAYPAFVLLADAVDLTCLEMDCPIAPGKGDQIGRAFWCEAQQWIQSVGLRKGRCDAALDNVKLTTRVITDMNASLRKSKEEHLAGCVADFEAEIRRLLKQ